MFLSIKPTNDLYSSTHVSRRRQEVDSQQISRKESYLTTSTFKDRVPQRIIISASVSCAPGEEPSRNPFCSVPKKLDSIAPTSSSPNPSTERAQRRENPSRRITFTFPLHTIITILFFNELSPSKYKN